VRLRAAVLDDAPAVLEVLAARDRADLGSTDHQLGALVDSWRGLGADLAENARLVEIGGRVVAYGIVRRAGSMVVVGPDHEGAGAGTLLLRWVEERERERGHRTHRQWIAAGNAAGRALLASAGYARAHSYVRMARRLDAAPPPAPRAPEVIVRPLAAAADAVALHALDAASFAGAPDYEPESLEEFSAEHLHASDLDPELSWVAEHGHEIAGFLLGHRWRQSGVGFVDLLAVHPEHQRRGIGTALLGEALTSFAANGLSEAQLGVAADNPRALRLYERAGMAPRFRFDTYERPLVPDP
jgi:mycothiol synthase